MSHNLSNKPLSTNAQHGIGSPPEKWYRFGMVWMMIALPLIAVVASLTTVAIAYKNAPQIIPISHDVEH